MTLQDIPESIRAEHRAICKECPERKFIAKRFDMHFDWVDCPYDCENDYEHLLAELEGNE